MGPVRQRHSAGLLGQLHGQLIPHRPADHEARGEIKDHGEVEPALCGSHVGAVPGPHPGWMRHRGLAIEGVLGHGQPVIRLVVARHCFTVLARMPFWRISRATRCSPTQCPCLISASQMLGLP